MLNPLLNPLPIALLSLSLVSSLGSAANAATFTRVLQTGQAVPGNTQPVSGIRSIAIDNQQNIVAIVKTQKISIPIPGAPFGIRRDSTFQGLYLFNSELVPTLVDSSDDYASSSLTQSVTLNASVNAGSVMLTRSNFARMTRGGYTDMGPDEVKVGMPGAFNLLLTASRFNWPTIIQPNTLALSNGKAFLLGEPNPNLTASPQKGLLKITAPNQLTEAIAATSPVFGSEPFIPKTLGQIVRASGNNVLLVTQNTKRYRVFSKFGTSAPKKIYDGTTGPFGPSSSCGAAISGSNIVVCSKEVKPTATGTNPYSLRVKFGNATPFQTIAFPDTTAIEQPSIAGKTVIFKAVTETQDKLYVSTDAQAPVQLLATGDTLDGKVVNKLNLSEQGQAIARTTDQAQNSSLTIVFIATFTDGTTGLYRGTL